MSWDQRKAEYKILILTWFNRRGGLGTDVGALFFRELFQPS
jgi:hypothetical protein